MADEVIMRRGLGLLLGLAFALTGMVQASMAQAQTALGAQTQIKVESFEAASTSLRAQYAEMVRSSGKVLTFAAEPESNSIAERWGHFVLYAPLNRLWLLDEANTVFEHAYIEVKQEPFDHLVLHWMHWLDRDISDVLPAAAQMPVFSVESTTSHPLATQYDALLAKPLAQALAPLPAGAYFRVGGHVFDTTGAQIANWESYGAKIALHMTLAKTSVAETTTANPQWHWFSVADLAAALNPNEGVQ